MRDVKAIGDAVILSVRSAIASAVAGISARVDALAVCLDALPAGPRGEKGDPGESIKGEKGESGESIVGPKGDPGESIRGDKGDAGESIRGEKGDIGERGEQGPRGDVGEKGEPGDVGLRGADGTPGMDGKEGAPGPRGEIGERGADGERGPIGESVYERAVHSGFSGTELQWLASLRGDAGPAGPNGERGETGPPVVFTLDEVEALAEHAASLVPKPADGRDGKDADPEAVKLMVATAVADIPKPKDGTSVTVEEVSAVVLPVLKEQIGALKPEKGEKGEPGKDGASVHPDTVALMVREAADKVAATMPKPKDGDDGFSLDDFDVALSEDGRTLTLKFQRGELKRERAIKLETMIYREVWREGEYERGDVCTWSGSAWHCQQQTEDKPGTSSAWRMMVKEGRPGKDGDAPAQRAPVVRTK